MTIVENKDVVHYIQLPPDVFESVLKRYKVIVRGPPPPPSEVCDCVLDVEHDGIKVNISLPFRGCPKCRDIRRKRPRLQHCDRVAVVDTCVAGWT